MHSRMYNTYNRELLSDFKPNYTQYTYVDEIP